MRSEWRTAKLIDVAAKKRWALNGGPFGSKLSRKHYRESGVPVIRGTNLSGTSKFSFDDFVYVSEEKADELRANNAHPGDLIFTQRGTIGQVGLIPLDSPVPRFVISQSQMKLTVDPEQADVLFLYYFFSAADTVQAIQNLAFAAGVPHINLDILRKFETPMPPLPLQRRIAGILLAYDELMENSQRRIRILEAMAHALYREWFVHFRFRGHEKLPARHVPLGDIPQGWSVKKLKNTCHLTMGQSPKSEFYNEAGEGQPFHQGVTDFGDRFPTGRLFCRVVGRVAEPGDILFSVRAPVGRMNIADKKIIIGRGLSAIRHKDGHQAFLWEQLRDRFTEDDMMGNGAIFAAVTKDDMQGIELICPPGQLVDAATKHFEPIHSEIGALTKQIQNLRQTRDLLLPRLLSGELKLPTQKGDQL